MATTDTAEDRHELTRLPIDRPTYDRLRRLAVADGRSMSWHRRQALREYLDRQERKA